MRMDLSQLPRVVTQDPIARTWAQAYEAAPDACLWTAEDVDLRMADAMRLVSATVGRVGPKQEGTGMPAYRHEALDIWFQQLAEDAEQRRGEKNRIRLRPGADEISMMEEAIGWQARYLDAHDGVRRVYKTWLYAKATRRRFARVCRKIGWPRSTANRRRWQGALLIATGLMRDEVALRLPLHIEENDDDLDE